MPFVKRSVALKKEKIVQAQLLRHAKRREEETAANIRAEREQAEAKSVGFGRRIVKLQLLGEALWCDPCDQALSLRYLEEEERHGLASIFIVRCHNCLAVYKISTDSKVPSLHDSGRSLYAVNLKAAAGLQDSGLGVEPLNKFFSVLNLPPVYRSTIIRAQDRVGPVLAEVAKESCKEAILLEKNMALIASQSRRTFSESDKENAMEISPVLSDPDDPAPQDNHADVNSTPRRRRVTINDAVSIGVKFDMGWDKRGNGRSYNSHSGRGSMIGLHSNKILGYDVVSNYCRKCALGAKEDDHKCARNYEGSAKGMEPHSAVKLIANNPDLKEAGVVVGQFIGDRDSSTIAALRRECSTPIEKVVDLNHNMSGFNNALYKLKLTHKWLQTSYIAHLKRQLGYAIKQNKGDVQGVQAAIMNIEKHNFGEHEECGDWCKAKENPENYVYKGLPRKTKFSETDQPGWRAALHDLLSVQAALAHTLAPCGSTQQNESFNHMCVTRAPKSRHYCGTEANYFRVSAAVCEKNLGSTYTEAVFQKAALSPSAFRTREKLQHRKMVKALLQARPDIKARRLHNKMKNSWKAANHNEGLTYESGMGNAMERASAAASVDRAWLPDAPLLTDSCVPVIVDLETTGFQASDEIVQIAVKCGNKEKSWYLIPKKNIHPKARGTQRASFLPELLR
ncbi:Ribonuclease T, partial [Frankliniella fusca]